MKRSMILLFAALSNIAIGVGQEEWVADKVHSNVMFTVRHLVISEVTGYFRDFDITVTAKSDDFSGASVDATVKINSIFTDNERRDGHLKSDDFFNVETFPVMKFRSKSFEKIDENKYKITGDLTIRDITKTVTFDATRLGMVSLPQMGTRCGWKVATTTNRFDFGLKWNKALETGGLVVGENVTITLNLELVQRPPGG